LLLVNNASSHFHNQPNVSELHKSNKPNSDDEIFNDNLELESRLTRTNQSASNSCGNHDKCVTGDSIDHDSSGY
ncbi:6325_t:CDS:2, partial [Racocetra fulgida]